MHQIETVNIINVKSDVLYEPQKLIRWQWSVFL